MEVKGGKEKVSSNVSGKVVVVAVKASKEIPKIALVWALTHVVQPGDCIKLLVVIPANSSSKRMWGFQRFTSDCTNGHRWSLAGTSSDQKDDIADACSQMVLELHDVYDTEKIKIVCGSTGGVVAAEAKSAGSNWVILDKLGTSPEHLKSKFEQLSMTRGPTVTPASSPDHESPMTTTDVGTSSISSSDPGKSPFVLSGIVGTLEKELQFTARENENLDECDSDTDSHRLSSCSTSSYFQPWMANILSSGGKYSNHMVEGSERHNKKVLTSTYRALLEKLSKLDEDPCIGMLNYRLDLDLSRSVREAISLSRNPPLSPPPLCSICQHKAPLFGNPPRWFTFAELEFATGGFSQENFLAEGGFGSVHQGVLPDSRVVAVKQYKLASSQGDLEFCSEVEVLSCAQHRNVVMLIGFCVEDGKRLLVYEYICNGSLDSHLYGRKLNPLEWSARQKIAIGAARGLRYLHEECRVGCIVHRDMRPNNILLTHDFEPLVGDFGLARWQPDGDMGVDTRVIGTFWYLALEYAQSGQITEKADVYSFGVVLLELVTGRKAMDINRPKGQQLLTEWARLVLEKQAVHELVDPCLRSYYSGHEVHRMLQCASLCIQRDPYSRPRMSQVLRMLEG
ncbi:hypothetical protein I3843_04G141400 [Carya illinoinensis]|nr:hypothetical protein I3843_04G141400 [Carya illinoinensis]